MTSKSHLFSGTAICTLAASLALGSAAFAQEVPIIQPGAPGQENRALTADEAGQIADNRYSSADVSFMQDMIWHHFQATQMAALVEGRTNTADLIEIAGRIDVTQADEIEFMQTWLTDRDEYAPDPATHEAHMESGDHEGHGDHHGDDHGGHHGGHHGEHTEHMSHNHAEMAGMASPEQMAALADANGVDFDALFLELMIAHHAGAVEMVDTLLGTSGSAYDPVLLEFANDVRGEQISEIRRMEALIGQLRGDPRNGLAAGFRDAGEAISNLTLVAALPKPTGFFDPANPEGLPPLIEDEDAEEDAEPRFGQRSSFLRFSQTDMAFTDNLMAVGNYHGFNMYNIEGEVPQLIASVVCPGGQGDVSIVGDILIMSVQDTRGRIDCGRQGIDEEVSDERFRGIRIFDISNPVAPRQVGLVQTCRGSHTHSVVDADDERIIVYNSGTSRVRPEEELAGCVSGLPGDEDTALFSIDVIEIPLDNPAASRIVDSPRVFANDETGRIAGLWEGGDHGDGTQSTRRTDQCHDITVFPALNIAAGACSGNGILLDISDPAAPTRIDAVVDQGFAYWHSATFNNEGTKVLFTDEWGGGGRPRCRAQDPMTWGANAIFDINDGQLEFAGYYKIGSVQTEQENCVAHNGSAIPVPGRDIFVQSWYQGGMSVLDFTDSANAFEIGFFDRGPVNEHVLAGGGYWSSYWYDGLIYATEISRGLDVFSLEPSEHLTENEIEAAKLADMGDTFNPQQQFVVTWPEHPVVGLAYIDQLNRDSVLDAELSDALVAALNSAHSHIEAGTTDRDLAGELRRLSRQLPDAEDGTATANRLTGLADVLGGVRNAVR